MRALAAVCLASSVFVTACVTKTVVTDQPAAATAETSGGVAATMTIERFLRAVNQNDIDTMASLFGTREGSVVRRWTEKEVDTRMFLLSSMLRHSDYSILGEQIVPGRRREATMFNVRMVLDKDTTIVPFTLVRTSGDAWLIEDVCTNRLTQRDSSVSCGTGN